VIKNWAKEKGRAGVLPGGLPDYYVTFASESE